NAGRLHPLITLTSAVPSTPLTAADQFLGISNEVTQRVSFQSGVGATHTINLEIHYAPAANSGYYTTYGVGCYSRPQSFYQYFAVPPGGFDLSNQGMLLVPNGSASYTVVPGSPMGAFTPVSSPVLGTATPTRTPAPNMGDDDVSAPITLPFTFSAPGPSGGISSNQIVIGSNGSVWLGGTAGGSFGFYDDVNRFLTDGARFALAF